MGKSSINVKGGFILQFIKYLNPKKRTKIEVRVKEGVKENTKKRHKERECVREKKNCLNFGIGVR